MTMPLDQWCVEVDRHLDLIEAGAQMCARHARQLPVRPAFESKAEEQLQRCEQVLVRSLASVRLAQLLYAGKREDAP